MLWVVWGMQEFLTPVKSMIQEQMFGFPLVSGMSFSNGSVMKTHLANLSFIFTISAFYDSHHAPWQPPWVKQGDTWVLQWSMITCMPLEDTTAHSGSTVWSAMTLSGTSGPQVSPLIILPYFWIVLSDLSTAFEFTYLQTLCTFHFKTLY